MSIEDERKQVMEMFAALERRVDGHERILHDLETLPNALLGIDKQLDKIDRRLDDGDRRMAEIEKMLAANTVITTNVRDAQIAGRVLTGVVKYVAAMVLACGAIWAAISTVVHMPGPGPK